MITSTSNPRVQAARKLRRRAGRDEARAFLVEGSRAVVAALAAGASVRDLFVDPDTSASAGVVRAASGSGVTITPASSAVIAALSDSTTPQGAVAVVGDPSVSLHDLAEGADLVLVLADVRDPGNAGTLLRSAVAAGADAIVFGAGSVDPFNPKTVRAAAGHLWSSGLVRGGALQEIAAALRERGFGMIGTAAGAAPVYDTDLTGPTALVLGNEAWGLGDDAARFLDATVGVPMPGPAESLNVAVAGSIVLFEAVRQRFAARSRATPAVYPRRSDA